MRGDRWVARGRLRGRLAAALALAAVAGAPVSADDAPRVRAREIGVVPGVLRPGALDAITDVAGVRVGHVTLIEGDRVRTGVTAILPHAGNLFHEKVPGAVFVGNAFGKLAGSTQVNELGTIETPILLTNTLAVGPVVEGVVRHTLDQSGNEDVRSVNAVVGEINDGTLNDIRGGHVRPEHAAAAIRSAKDGPVEEGSVGGGTGAIAFGWKGGVGTASRQALAGGAARTVGVLVVANFGGVLTINGAPVGRELGHNPFAPSEPAHDDAAPAPPDALPLGGSCMIVVATDAPLDARELRRLAARAVFALARTGSSYSNGSGDYAIAFSTAPDLRVRHGATAPQSRTLLPADAMSPLFEAVLEATEEAVYNALFKAATMAGSGHTVEAIPLDRVAEICRRYQVLNLNKTIK